MAHGDALIFLTNITWIFFLFVFIYLFFVVFFLPLFYKKFRIRSLIAGLFKIRATYFLRNVFVSITFALDFFRGLFVQLVSYFVTHLYFFGNFGLKKSVIFFNLSKFGGVRSSVSAQFCTFLESRAGVPVSILRFKR